MGTNSNGRQVKDVSLIYKHAWLRHINYRILFSNLVPLAQGSMKRNTSQIEVPKNTCQWHECHWTNCSAAVCNAGTSLWWTVLLITVTQLVSSEEERKKIWRAGGTDRYIPFPCGGGRFIQEWHLLLEMWFSLWWEAIMLFVPRTHISGQAL